MLKSTSLTAGVGYSAGIDKDGADQGGDTLADDIDCGSIAGIACPVYGVLVISERCGFTKLRDRSKVR